MIRQYRGSRQQLDAEAAEIEAQISRAIETKSYEGLDEIQRRLDDLAEAREQLDRREEKSADPRIAKIAADSGNAADSPVRPREVNKRPLGRDVCPLAFKESDMLALTKAMQEGRSIRIKGFNPQEVQTKAFSSTEALLPPELHPAIIARIHEHRLLDRLPVIAMSAPSIEFIVHQSSTGTPAITAEGALKSDVTLNFVSNTLTAQKIACTFGLSWEVQLDHPTVLGYATGEVFKEVIDVENSALINGSSGIVGFQQTSGILTLAYSTGAYLDAISTGIENLRVGSALATPTIAVVHPGTWGAIRRQKDAQSRYLVAPDPTAAQAENVWGVPILATTACPAGTMLLIDTEKFGYVVMRQNLVLMSGFTNDDFQRNINRWAVEERLNLAVERPAAVLNITGLPTS